MKPIQLFLAIGRLAFFGCNVALAHDPIFNPGPRVLLKEGVEKSLKQRINDASFTLRSMTEPPL